MQNAASVEPFSIGGAIDKGFKIVNDNLWIFIGTVLAANMLPGVPAFLAWLVAGLTNQEKSIPLMALVTLIQVFLQMALMLGLMKFCLKKYDNQEAGFADLFSCFSPPLRSYLF